jgi:hypothetical protein
VDYLVVVAFRMPQAGMTAGPEGDYLNRARSLCTRGEALGGRLVAWGASSLAMAWDIDSIEEGILLATSVREESLSPERSWACGVAEGELEPLAPDGQRMQLAWGAPLLLATSLARIARAGEVLVDGEVGALRDGDLAVVGARSSTDAGRHVRGWRLDLSHPWRRGAADGPDSSDSTDRDLAPPPEESSLRSHEVAEPTRRSLTPEAIAEELSSSDLLQTLEAPIAPAIAEPNAEEAEEAEAPSSTRPRSAALADRVRALSGGESGSDPAEALAELRRARALAEAGPPAGRCQAALALAMTLSIAGRPEEALLEALDALARARDVEDRRAIGACMALLAKLYAAAGLAGAATKLREGLKLLAEGPY